VILYADSSALVKYYLDEPDSPVCRALIDRAEAIGTSEIARAEVSAAVAKALRLGLVLRTQAEEALKCFRVEWPDYARVPVTEQLVARADQLAWEQALRGYDAVHLAAALMWRETVAAATLILTYDRELARAARAVGIMALPELPLSAHEAT